MHPAIRLLKKIPKGKVATYRELARVCRTSPRAIGSIMAHNQDPMHFPCYKVVLSSGDIGGYSGPGGVKGKIALLRRDGIRIAGHHVDKRYFYLFGKVI